MADSLKAFKRIGIVGAGNMGSMMSLGLSERGHDISIWDVSKTNVDEALRMAREETATKGEIEGFYDIKGFTDSLEKEKEGGGGRKQKLLIFSITHGSPADSVLDQIKADLKKGDIILDGGNEHYRNTERRQRDLEPLGVHWVGMGVSGGYQSARRGPSLSPGGNKEAIEAAMPVLESFAAKDPETGTSCVANIGPRGAGHYVKMCHNGIENGMLSTLSEAWSILHKSLGMSNDEIGKIFEQWNAKGELRNTFLVQIGSEICQRKKTPEGDGRGEGVGKSGYVLDDVLDKVVQDDDNTEGTLYWTVMEAAYRHVAAPTIATGHFIRVASGNRDQRVRVAEKLKIPGPKKQQGQEEQQVSENNKFVEELRRAVYVSFLSAFCQGLELVARASKDEGWDVNLATCIRIWRAGCIIQENYIANMLQPILESGEGKNRAIMNMKLIDEVAAEIRKHFEPLKRVTMKAIEWDNYVPSMSASLEYIKYEGGTMLPTQFMEAEMDFFGAHGYDRPGVAGEDPGKVSKGAHHYEWRPA